MTWKPGGGVDRGVRCLSIYQFVGGLVQTICYGESSGELLEEFVVEAEESWLASERSFLVHPSVLKQNSHLQDVRANFSRLNLGKKLTRRELKKLSRKETKCKKVQKAKPYYSKGHGGMRVEEGSRGKSQ